MFDLAIFKYNNFFKFCQCEFHYHNFDKAQWDIIRDKKTGKGIVSISFFKEYKDGTAKAVEVKVSDDKKLKLKTLFRIDKGVLNALPQTPRQLRTLPTKWHIAHKALC